MSKYNWENPEIFNINKEDGHAIAMPYDSPRDAISLGDSPYRMSLNGKWKFFWHRGIKNQPNGFEANDYLDDTWGEIKVPSVWQTQGYSVPYYYASTFPRAISRSKHKIPKIDHKMQEIGFYRRHFYLKQEWQNREIFIHFGAVKSALELYINGEFVGYSQGSMTPHEFDITKYVKKGNNTVACKVYRYCDGTYLEDQDMWWLCGIYRDVYVFAESKPCIRDFFFKTEFPSGFSECEVSLDGYIKNYSAQRQAVAFSAALVDMRGKTISLGKTSKILDGDVLAVKLTKKVTNPKLWSAEHPYVYTLIMTLENAHGIVAVKKYTVGFKQVKIVGEKIMFNGKPLMIKGVNRHDFDPDCGWAVPKKRYKQDLDIMKQCNINAIRTSHYPDDPFFYEMCNHYGFYVMDECDLESHGVRRKGVPGSNPKWTGAAVDRMCRMVLRDRNNPCIFMWSLGNEAGDGDNLTKMKEAALELDDTRQFHYEGDFDLTKSDVISRMYPTADVMKQLGNKEEIKTSLYDNIANQLAADNKPIKSAMYQGKPVILCEYAHSMENSLGNFKEYMDDFEKYDNMCGGFIWDFVDQTIHTKSDDGKDMWLYGTDFAKLEPKKLFSLPNTTAIGGSNTYFCANGIIGADRIVHPQIYEVKKVYSPIEITAVDADDGIFNVKNKFLFTGLNEYTCNWKIEIQGRQIMYGKIDEVSCAPLSETIINIPYKHNELPTTGEVVLTISFCNKYNSYGIQSEYEAVWEQFVLNPMKQPKAIPVRGDLTFSQKRGNVSISNDVFNLLISNGQIIDWVYKGRTIIKTPVMPNYFRALTDNDIDFYNFTPPIIRFNPYYKWQKATRRTSAIKTVVKASEDNSVEVHIAMKTPGLKDSKLTYKVYPDGRVYVFHSAVPKRDMIKFGFSMGLYGDMEYVTWYGRGPHPTYEDRKTGAKIGIYKSSVTKLEHRYMRPQESSNRTDTRYLAIMDKGGNGMMITSYYDTPFNFSAYHYTTDALEKAQHIHEIPYDVSLTTLNIDHMQCGVGGDLPGQANVREPYKMNKGEKQGFSFVMEPIVKE